MNTDIDIDIIAISDLVDLAKKVNLIGVSVLDRYTYAELSKIYNGIGAESFPIWLRDAISALHPSLQVVALIHDVEWENSDGTVESFTASNERFKENGYLIAKYNYKWYDPRRYIVMCSASKFAKICQNFGFIIWKSNVGKGGS